MPKFKTPQDIKVGVIGYGGAFNMGRQHLTFMKQAGMSPVAVSELDRERLKVAQEEFPGIQTYDSVAKMLKESDVNLVVIIQDSLEGRHKRRRSHGIAAHLSKGEDLIITPEWSRRPIHILDLACRSAEQGKTIKAKYA